MISEQRLLDQWRQLPVDKQQEVLDFVVFLAQRNSSKSEVMPMSDPRTQFQHLREQIIAAGIPLLSDAEIEQEVADRRGGYQETAS
ncbi:hypothetical protein ACN4EG_22705 [Alkalinema pantanalense CENA528]|uniref:hypothetical protein n=1 Tax=Alkalinema pantanalense TaxID=1620705 RepID=UPI003D6F9A01